MTDRILVSAIVAGLVGARLYYDIQNTDLIHTPIDIVAVWNGGMDFFGAILAVFAVVAVLGRRHHVSYWLLTDATALFGVVGQPIGRLGNNLQRRHPGDAELTAMGDGLHQSPRRPAARLPTLRSAGDLPRLSAGGRLRDPRNTGDRRGAAVAPGRGVHAGVLGITYVAAYAVSQLILFQLRATEPVVLWGLKQSQWTSIGLLVLVVPALLALRRRFPPPLPGSAASAAPP